MDCDRECWKHHFYLLSLSVETFLIKLKNHKDLNRQPWEFYVGTQWHFMMFLYYLQLKPRMGLSEILRPSCLLLEHLNFSLRLRECGLWAGSTCCQVPVQAEMLISGCSQRDQWWPSHSLPWKFVHPCAVLNPETGNIVSLDPSRSFSQRNRYGKRIVNRDAFWLVLFIRLENWNNNNKHVLSTYHGPVAVLFYKYYLISSFQVGSIKYFFFLQLQKEMEAQKG